MTKEPHVKVSMGFYLRNAPKGHLGLRSETWNFGLEPATLDQLILSIACRLSQFYSATMGISAGELNAQLKRAGEAITNLKFEDREAP